MGKPVKHRDKWRIRWLDEHGKRKSTVHDDYKFTQTELRRHQVEVEKLKRGIRNAAPPDKTFDAQVTRGIFTVRIPNANTHDLRPRRGALPPPAAILMEV